MNKHTPGPWIYNKHKAFGATGTSYMIHDNKFRNAINIAHVIDDIDLDPEAVEANARVISAAPELLEALQAVVEISDRNHIAWDKAKAAIKKATE